MGACMHVIGRGVEYVRIWLLAYEVSVEFRFFGPCYAPTEANPNTRAMSLDRPKKLNPATTRSRSRGSFGFVSTPNTLYGTPRPSSSLSRWLNKTSDWCIVLGAPTKHTAMLTSSFGFVGSFGAALEAEAALAALAAQNLVAAPGLVKYGDQR